MHILLFVCLNLFVDRSLQKSKKKKMKVFRSDARMFEVDRVVALVMTGRATKYEFRNSDQFREICMAMELFL